MTRALICLWLLLGLVCCKDQASTGEPWVNVCEDLGWLEEIKGEIMNSGNKGRIYLHHYKGDRVIEVDSCVECADSLTVVYDCSGNVICEFGGIGGLFTCTDYPLTSDDKLLLWQN